MKHEIFTSAWWNLFLKESKNLSQTTLWKKVLSDGIGTLTKFSERTLRIALSENLSDQTFRVWMDGRAVLDKSIIQSALEKSTSPVVDVMRHTQRVDTVGMILNYCENLDEELKLFIGNAVSPLLRKHGMPTHGIEISLFTGNYNHTPIGFHLDQRGHRVIHLQIGPGTKEMYLIPRDKFEHELVHITAGQKNFHEVEKLLPYAERYTIEPGDIFFMPYGFYHVGKNIGTSTSITVWLENMQTESLAERMIVPMARKIFSNEGTTLVGNDTTAAGQTNFLFNNLKTMIDQKNVLTWSVEKLLRYALQDFKYRLHSNNFFVPGKPLRRHSEKITLEQEVQWTGAYSLLTRKNGGMRDFYYEGERFTFFDNKNMLKILQLLKRGKPVTVKRIAAGLSAEWESAVTLEFIHELTARKVLKRLPLRQK